MFRQKNDRAQSVADVAVHCIDAEDDGNRNRNRTAVNRSVTCRRITTDAVVMCARAVDEAFNNNDHKSSSSQVRQTGNDVMSSCMTSSGESPVPARLRRRGIPLAWRYSLPSTITHSSVATTALRRPTTSSAPNTVSISGDVNEPCKYIATGSRNVAESGPRIRPTCLRYSYWLTLDDHRRYATKYSTTDKFGGCEDQLKRHFRPRSCEIISVGREPASCRVVSPGNGEAALNNDHQPVLGLHHPGTGSCASEQTISSTASALDVKTDSGIQTTSRVCTTVRLNPDDDHDARNDRVGSASDVNVDRSRDEAEVGGRLSLSKIGDSGLGASIHSEQVSPDEPGLVDHHQLTSRRDDDVTECQCQTRCEGQGHSQCHVHHDVDDDDDDDRTKLTRHKRE